MANNTKRIHILTESAIMVALATVLSMLKIWEAPYGGSVTVLSMAPIIILSMRRGVKVGLFAGFAHSLIQLLLGLSNVSYIPTPMGMFLCVLTDYILPFTLLGLGGIFRNKINNPGVSLMCGSLVALGARYLAHILSGYILFSGWAEWFFTQDGFPAWGASLVQSLSPSALGWVYSIVYNGIYMVPEMILTAIAALLIARVPKIVTKVS